MIRDCLSLADLMGEFLLSTVKTAMLSNTDVCDRHAVFDDTFMLELAVSAYYSQISHFTIDV